MQCSISVAGFHSNDEEVGVPSYTFAPKLGEELYTRMVEVVLPDGFVGLHNVTIM